MTTERYDHLNLKAWPFNVSASAETARVWVGREGARKQLEVLLRGAQRVDASQIALLWAGFGAGKTHALRYLQFRAQEIPELMPLYVVVERGIKSFLDIYRSIIDAALDAGAVVAAGRDLFDSTGGNVNSDMDLALIRVGMYPPEESQTAISWLRGERVPIRDLKDIGISRRLESTTDAVEALDHLMRVLERDGSVRVVLMLDEMQEFEELGRFLNDCRGGLHKLFDRNPTGLTLVLSFTTGTQATMNAILGETLVDRSSTAMTLPAIDRAEGVELIEGLVREWSIDPARSPFPFADVHVIRQVVEKVAAEDLTPRGLIKVFDRVLRQAEFDIADKKIGSIDADYALARA
jgi:hypothetical protein